MLRHKGRLLLKAMVAAALIMGMASASWSEEVMYHRQSRWLEL